MERDYSIGVKNDVKFFLGKEVERTPAYGLKTLFVVGLHDSETIEKLLDDAYLSIGGSVKHIYFGANHSFAPEKYEEWQLWEDMIKTFLYKDYLCTLDIPLSHLEEFLDGGLCEHSNFIPQIMVPIPYTKLFNYNTMVKIDDKDFKATNPGVWCHSLHDLMDRSKFTPWSEYTSDEVLK